jgi:hypothetical protein
MLCRASGDSRAFSLDSYPRADVNHRVASRTRALDGPSAGCFHRIFGRFIGGLSAHRMHVPAAIAYHCIHRRPDKDWRPYGSYGMLGIVGSYIQTSYFFRRLTILCAVIPAFLPAIEIPTSIAAPCWISFALEVLC